MEKFVRPRSCCICQTFKVKVYIGVKIKICVNCVKTCTNIFLVSHGFRNIGYTFTYFQCLSLEVLAKRSKVRV